MIEPALPKQKTWATQRVAILQQVARAWRHVPETRPLVFLPRRLQASLPVLLGLHPQLLWTLIGILMLLCPYQSRRKQDMTEPEVALWLKSSGTW